MPRTIDDKIVEMRFDNRDFEKNTKQSMATLDKLKTSLDMSDAERNFNKISKASDGLSFRDASNSVDTFSVKLSAMSSVAVAAIGRITNQLMDLGEQMVRNVIGVDYIGSGFSKYEEMIGYQQNMLTVSKNLTEDQMQELLDKLVWFSDETSFSSASMMQAMSSYMAAGVDEVTSQAAAIGTALWAAFTGNSNESLARANLNLPQIFGRGYMMMEDWKSIVNAKMDTPAIRELFMETAAELKKLKKVSDGTYKSLKNNVDVNASTFTGTFKEQWLDTEVLMKSFSKLSKFTDDVYDRVNETGQLAYEVIEEMGEGLDDLGVKALTNAQATKTWSEAWAYVQGALSAGWAQTWNTLFGNFGEAKEFFSDIVESLYGIFVEPGNERNNLFSAWAEFTPEVEKTADDLEEITENVETLGEKLKNVRDVVLNIIRGNYGNGKVRIAALAEEFGAETGAELQQIVNQVWKQWDGPDKKWSLNYELLDKITANRQISSKTAEAIKEAAESLDKTEEEEEKLLNGREDLLEGIQVFLQSVSSIRQSIGYALGNALSQYFDVNPEGLYNFTHKIADYLRSWEEKAKNFDTGIIYRIVEDLRLLKDIVHNLLSPVFQVGKTFKEAFSDTFFGDRKHPLKGFLFDLSLVLERIKTFTARFKLSDEQLEKLRTTFKGLLTPVKIVGSFISSLSDAIFKVFERMGKDSGEKTFLDRLLDIGEGIANIIIGFDEWLDKTGAIDNFVVPAIEFVSKTLGDIWAWIKKILGLDTDKEFLTFDDIFAGWQNAKSWIHEHIIQPINDFFNIDLHIPTWEEIAKGWGDIKGWISEHIVNPFSEFIGKFTGGKEIKWPTWDGLKAKWKDFKDWFHDNVVAPFEQMTGIDLHFPTLDEVKDFFGKIWDWISKLFGGAKGAEKAEESVKEQEHSWEVIGNIFGVIFNLIKRIFEAIGQVVTYLSENETLNKALNAGIIGGFLGLIIKLIDAFSNLSQLNPLAFLNYIGTGIGRLMNASANQRNAEALNDMAVSVAILVGSLILLSLLPVDQMKAAMDTLVELVAVVGGFMAILRNLNVGTMSRGVTGGGSDSKLFDPNTWGLSFGMTRSSRTYDELTYALLEIAGAIAIMAASIRIIAKLNPTEMRNGLFVIEELLMIIIGALALLNASAKTLKSETKQTGLFKKDTTEESLETATMQFLSIAALIWVLAASIKKLSTIPNFDTNNAAFTAIVILLGMVEGLVWAVTKAASNSATEGKKAAKATAPLMAVLFTIVGLVLAIVYVAKNFTPTELKSFEKVAGWIVLLTGLVGLIAVAIVGFVTNAEPKTPKQTEKGKIIKMAAAIAIITAAMSVLILSLTAAMAVMLSMIKEGLTDKQMDLVSEYMRILLLAIVVVAGFAAGLALMAGKMSDSDFKNLLGLAAIVAALSAGISVLVLSMSVFAKSVELVSIEKTAVILGGVALIVLILVGMLAVIVSELRTNATMSGGSGSNTFLKLIGLSVLIGMLTAGISLIVLAMAKLAEAGDWTAILTTAGAVTLVVLAIMAFMATLLGMTKNLGGSGGGDFARLAGLTMAISSITLGLSVLVLSLSKLTQSGDIMKIVATLGMFSLLILALTVMLAGLSAIESNSGGSVMKVGAAFLGIAAGMALLSLGLGEIIKNTAVSPGGTKALWQAVLALTALMAVITIAAAIAGIPMVTAGFTAISVFFVAVGSSALMVAAGLTLIVTALTKFKDAIYDIGQNADKFEQGLNAVFVGLARALWNALPNLLKTLYSVLSSLPTSIIDLIIELLKTLNARTPEIIKQIAESIIRLLSGLGQYIGPIISTLLDFIVNLLEGLAFAINMNAGRITAAIMDVLVSIVVLTNNALSALLSSLFHFIGLDVLGDKITEVFGWISKKSVKAFSAAGDDVIKTSEEVSKDIINSSPRLAEYYKKYSENISNAISTGSDGITTTISESGSGISGAMSNMFDSDSMKNKLSELSISDLLTGSYDLNLDPNLIRSYGESSGLNFSLGFDEGLKDYKVEDMFPTTEDYYEYGKKAAEAQRSGQVNSLETGIESGQITTVAAYKDFLERTGATGGVFDSINEAIEKGAVNAQHSFSEVALGIIRSTDAAAAAEAVQKKAISDTSDAIAKAASTTGYSDMMNAYGLDDIPSAVKDSLEALITLNDQVTDLSAIPDDTKKSLDKLREVLATYDDPGVTAGIDVIDRLLGISGSTEKVDTSAITKYLKDRGDLYDKWSSVRQEKLQKVIDDTERAQNGAKRQQQRVAFAAADESAKYVEDVVFSEGTIYQRALNDLTEKLNRKYGKYLNGTGANGAVTIDDLAKITDEDFDVLKTFISRKEIQLIEWVRKAGPGLADKVASSYQYKLYAGLFASDDGEIQESLKAWAANIANEILRVTEDPSSPLFPLVNSGLFSGIDLAKISEGNADISFEDFMYLAAAMYKLGGDTGREYVNGLLSIINPDASPDTKNKVLMSTSHLGNFMAQSTRNVLKIKSPSRVGADIGKNFVLGVAEGVEDTTDEAGLASEETALSMAQRLKNAISAAVGFNLEDLSPVIRPILDLDAITAGASQINGLVGGNMVYGRFGVGPAGYGDLQAIAQMNKTGLVQAIQESVLTQPVNQTVNNTFNIQSNDPNEVARRVSAILSSQVQRKQQVWGPAKVNRATQ